MRGGTVRFSVCSPTSCARRGQSRFLSYPESSQLLWSCCAATGGDLGRIASAPAGFLRSQSELIANLGYNPTGPLVNRPMLSNQKISTGPDILQNAEYYPLTNGRVRTELEADGSPDYRRLLRFGARAHQRHAVGGQRARRHIIARTSISGIRWVEALLHPDRVGHVDQAHEKGTVAFSECVSAGASTKPSGIRTRTAADLGAGNWRPPAG